MTYGLQVFDSNENLTLDSRDYTVRMVVQTLTSFGSIGWNSYVDVPLSGVKAGMPLIISSLRNYSGASTLTNSTASGSVNSYRPRSLPKGQAFDGFVRLSGHGVSPAGYTKNEYTNIPYRTNDRQYLCEWVEKSRQVRVNRPKYECWYENQTKYSCWYEYNFSTGRQEQVCGYKTERVQVCGYKDNWVWETERYTERECKWVDNWVWKDSWDWRLTRGTTSTIEGNVIIQVFTNV